MRNHPSGFELDDCLSHQWRGEGLFSSLAPEALEEFDAMTFSSVYPRGAVLYEEGQAARGAIMICHGSAKLSISSNDGRTLITRIVPAGEFLGLSTSILGTPYKSTAETLEPTHVNFVRRDDLLRFIDTHHDACLNLARVLSRECEVDADHIRSLELAQSAAERLASLILSWCTADGKPTSRAQLLRTHEHVSQLIGTSRETVTRLLNDFQQRNLIAIQGANLFIRDRAALESLVHT